MNCLNSAIARAEKEQYPNGTPYQKAEKQSERERWVSHLDRHLIGLGFIIVPKGTDPASLKWDWNVIQQELRFHPERLWRFDRAIPSLKIGIEIDGGSFGRVVECNHCHRKVTRMTKQGREFYIREGGRHNTGAGMEADHEKINAAVMLGWRVLRFVPTQIKDGYAQNLIYTLAKAL